MRRRRLRVPVVPEPPLRIRRFVAAEWGWDGPAYEDGYLVLGHYEANRRYLTAWSDWCDEHDVNLMDWFDRYGLMS
jgi:hypothetical protein